MYQIHFDKAWNCIVLSGPIDDDNGCNDLATVTLSPPVIPQP